jgi:hypothetical protein
VVVSNFTKAAEELPATTRDAEAVCLSLPLVPVAVVVELPPWAPLAAVIVNVEVPEPTIEVGLKLPVTPAGRPDTPRLTAPVKPLTAATVTV